MFTTRQTKHIVVGLVLAMFTLGSNVALPSRPVSLYVTVESDGKLIGGLSAENFRLLEQERPRPFRLEQPETPASVVLLVEHSESSWLYYNDIVSSVRGFINAAPGGNWYALATFAQKPEVGVDFTKQKGKLFSVFSGLGLPMRSEVNTYDAVYLMLEKLERMSGRRILIVIGSGFDSFSAHTLEDVQRKIEAANVLVYGVGAGSVLRGYYDPYLGSMARMDLLRAEAFLKMLAEKSGGQAWFPRFEAAFADILQGVMQMLEYQYKLVYNSQLPADGKFHEIEVEAFRVENDKREDYEVRVREGWRFERT